VIQARCILKKYAREDIGALRCIVRETSNGPASDDLQMPKFQNNGIGKGQLTVELMAAGTFAIIDMTGLRFKSMKIYNSFGISLIQNWFAIHSPLLAN
jgi:hypothetical protein